VVAETSSLGVPTRLCLVAAGEAPAVPVKAVELLVYF